MRQAVTTRYLWPTDSKGSRIKALARKARPECGWKEMSHTRPVSYPSINGDHALAAQELATKLGWSGLWIAGEILRRMGTCMSISQALAILEWIGGADGKGRIGSTFRNPSDEPGTNAAFHGPFPDRVDPDRVDPDRVDPDRVDPDRVEAVGQIERLLSPLTLS